MKKAFTLVEMLVVIAIIGILATAILVSLGPARNQARDARIRADVQQLRNLAETYYNTHNFDYRGFAGSMGSAVNSCSSNTPAGVQALCNDITNQNGGTAPTFFATQDNVAIFATLASGGAICMDTQGNFKTYSGMPTSLDDTCP